MAHMGWDLPKTNTRYSVGCIGRKMASVVHVLLTLVFCARWVATDLRKKIGGGR